MALAVWGHPYSEFPVGQDSLDDFRRGFERLAASHVTTYYAFVLTHGKAYFRSRILGEPERDLLAPAIEVGDEFDIEVHPIIGLGAVGVQGGLYDPGTSEDLPSWARDWPCPSWAESRQLTVRVAQEMLDQYEPAGLHMDYVRYPNTAVLDSHPCHCERCRVDRLGWLGKEVPSPEDLQRPAVVYKELQMRGKAVRALVRGLRDAADDAGVPLSMAARARYLKDAVAEGQDWAQWAEEELIDAVCPMSYNPCNERFARFLEEHTGLLASSDVLWFAGVGRKSSLGEIGTEQMMQQIDMAMRAGADGVCIFHAGALTADDHAALATIDWA